MTTRHGYGTAAVRRRPAGRASAVAAVASAVLVGGLLVGGSADAAAGRDASCATAPPHSFWRAPVDTLPVHPAVPRSDRSYVWPARHQAGAAADPSLPPMGLRLRLKDSVDTSRLAPQAEAVAEALKTYGAIVADNGSAWYLTGEENAGWDNAQLDGLKGFKGSDFEAVDASGLQQSPDSGAVAPR